MEAVRDFIACGDRTGSQTQVPRSGVDDALAVLQAVSATAVEDAGSWGFRTASDFAGRMEEVSRTVEYLQLVAAAAVDRTRKQSANTAGDAAGAATSWTTGWRDSPGGWQTGASGTAVPAGTTAGETRPRRRRRLARGAGSRQTRRLGRRQLRMTGTGTPRSSYGHGCGSALRRPGAGSPSPRPCCPDPDSPAGRCRPYIRNSPPPSRPARLPRGPRRSSPSHSTGSGPSAARTPRPGWSTP